MTASIAPPLWHKLAPRFSGDRDCIASFLALEAAEVLAGARPACLISLADRTKPCGKNLLHLWRDHARHLLDEAGLAFEPLRDSGETLLVLVYDRNSLAKLLADRRTAAVLRKAGYAQPESVPAALHELSGRMGADGFPHEIGVFLGYPLRDVVSFMGWTRLPFTVQRLWRIYGDPKESLRVAELFRRCRCEMACRLADCTDPAECLRRAA